MSLFVINRYQEHCLEEEHQETAHLERLKAQIEERRKARLQDTDKSSHCHNDSNPGNQSFLDSNYQQIEETYHSEITHKGVSFTQFKVLGTKEFGKTTKVKRILPFWLSNPTPISVDLKHNETPTENIKYLDASLKRKMLQGTLCHLFPVQEQVIPWLLQENKKSLVFRPRDVCVSAPTGSGKTLTYVLPIIQILSDRVERQIRALVILPVKELALQVARVFKDYCVGTNLKVCLLVGSVSFYQEQQSIVRYDEISGWHSEADIIVCTAGRLVEHIRSTAGFSLKHLKFLVMDEADRIMNHVQNDWLHHLNRHVQFEDSIMAKSGSVVDLKNLNTSFRPPQKILLSATLSQDPEKLNQWNLFQPKLFSAAFTDCKKSSYSEKFTTPLELTEKYSVCSSENKPLVLYHIIKSENCNRVLCFTNSSQSAHRLTMLLTHLLNNELSVAELSASRQSKKTREAVLRELQSGKLNVLISTDALARGIDVPDCDLVISYDSPKNVKTYVHRIGRTSRAGRPGKAITMVLHSQFTLFKDIIKTTGKQDIEKMEILQDTLEQYSGRYKTAMESFSLNINDESQAHKHNLKSIKRGKFLPNPQQKYKLRRL